MTAVMQFVVPKAIARVLSLLFSFLPHVSFTDILPAFMRQQLSEMSSCVTGGNFPGTGGFLPSAPRFRAE